MFQNPLHQKIKRNNHSGFTIIEVMIAISIFAIGFLAISSLQFSASRNNRTASEITQAASIVADRMERIMAMPYTHSDLDPALNPHMVSQEKYDIQWVVTDSDLNFDGINDAKTINMTVSWDRLLQPGSGTRTISIDFIKPDA
jgi:prepilin-type N-terminal cleavage/methylation domain-containing protein